MVSPQHASTLASWGDPARTELKMIADAGHTFQSGDKIRRTPPQLLEMIEAGVAWMRRWMVDR